MFVTHLLYSVAEDTTSGCKIKKNSDFPSTYANKSSKLFLGRQQMMVKFWRHIFEIADD